MTYGSRQIGRPPVFVAGGPASVLQSNYIFSLAFAASARASASAAAFAPAFPQAFAEAFAGGAVAFPSSSELLDELLEVISPSVIEPQDGSSESEAHCLSVLELINALTLYNGAQ